MRGCGWRKLKRRQRIANSSIKLLVRGQWLNGWSLSSVPTSALSLLVTLKCCNGAGLRNEDPFNRRFRLVKLRGWLAHCHVLSAAKHVPYRAHRLRQREIYTTSQTTRRCLDLTGAIRSERPCPENGLSLSTRYNSPPPRSTLYHRQRKNITFRVAGSLVHPQRAGGNQSRTAPPIPSCEPSCALTENSARCALHTTTASTANQRVLGGSKQ